MWRTTSRGISWTVCRDISIHVPRVEDDVPCRRSICQRRYFNPRPPCGGRLSSACPPRGRLRISIHVPRVEDDEHTNIVSGFVFYFNPRPPCGGRLQWILPSTEESLFQSTSPVWRTTSAAVLRISTDTISIHVPRVEDDLRRLSRADGTSISIHVPRVEDDHTSSLRPDMMREISIHVPRVEDDMEENNEYPKFPYFNPRPPCGGRQLYLICEHDTTKISIHVPRVEDD